jgi:hypothetical protein
MSLTMEQLVRVEQGFIRQGLVVKRVTDPLNDQLETFFVGQPQPADSLLYLLTW